jgi:alpha-1,2-mannosyltransferase
MPERMSIISPPVHDAAPSSFKAAAQFNTASRRQFYWLRVGEMTALIVFLSFCVMWVQWQAPNLNGHIVPADFVGFWTAGELALEGHAADAYIEMPHFFKQLALHGDTTQLYFSFFYPPFFLLLCSGLALLNYFSALCLWLASTFIGYAAALRALLPKSLGKGNVWLLFLGYPAVQLNIGFGQNGFLSTALLGGATIWLDRRPELAGLCFGCLAYKPQLGIIVPLVLVVARRWRVFIAASLTVAALAMISTLVFGVSIWGPFLDDMSVARHNWLEAPVPSYIKFLITIFAAVRLHGGSLTLAYTIQALVTVSALGMLIGALLMRPAGTRSGRAEGAAIAAAVPFCSPYMLEYDLLILAIPMAWLLGEALRNGFRRGEGLALAATFVAPVVFQVEAFDNALKLWCLVAAALLFAVVLRRVIEPVEHPIVREIVPLANSAPHAPVILSASSGQR